MGVTPFLPHVAGADSPLDASAMPAPAAMMEGKPAPFVAFATKTSESADSALALTLKHHIRRPEKGRDKTTLHLSTVSSFCQATPAMIFRLVKGLYVGFGL